MFNGIILLPRLPLADCKFISSPTGKHDAWNGVIGGLAAGGVVGLRTSSMPMAVGTGIAFAFASAMTDITGQKLSGDGLFDDNATRKPIFYPYPEGESS